MSSLNMRNLILKTSGINELTIWPGKLFYSSFTNTGGKFCWETKVEIPTVSS